MTGAHDPESHEPEQTHPLAPPPSPRRRVPGWVLVVAGLVVLVLVGGLIALITNNRAEPAAAPDDVVVTLPPPSPSLAPVERSATTAFAQGLPSTVLQFALVEESAEASLLVEGALEGHRLTYSDGAGADLVVLASQWRDADAAAAAFAAHRADLEAAAAAAVPEGEAAPPGADDADADEAEGSAGAAEDDADVADETATDAPADDAPDAATPAPALPQDGPVQVDGTEVGAYAIVPMPDGTGTALWHNGTALVEVTGPAEVLAEFFAAFPM